MGPDQQPAREAPQARGRIVIVGAGGHAVSVADVALAAGWELTHFVAAGRSGQRLLGLPIVDALSDVPDLDATSLTVAIGDNAVRETVGLDLLERVGEQRMPCLVHPTASVSPFATLGCGTVVMAQANVGPNCVVGRFCLLNTASSLDHDGRMADAASLAPGVITGGTVRIGPRSAVSIGAAVMHRVQIGADCVIGGKSYVNRDVPDLQVVYGTPARIVRVRRRGDTYL